MLRNLLTLQNDYSGQDFSIASPIIAGSLLRLSNLILATLEISILIERMIKCGVIEFMCQIVDLLSLNRFDIWVATFTKSYSTCC